MKPAITLILLLLFCARCFSEEYQVVLSRPERVGHKSTIEMEIHEEQTMELFANDQLVKENKESYDLKFAGVETVLAIDTKRNRTRISIVVDQFIKTTGGLDEPVLNKGDEIVGWREGRRKVVHVNGAPPEEKLKKLVEKVVSVKRDGAPSDDEIFGTAARVKVGDEWPINREAAAADLAELGTGITAGDVTGHAMLKRAVNGPGGKQIEIAAVVSIARFRPLGPEFQKQDGKMEATFSGLFPLDPGRPKTFEQFNATMDLHAMGLDQKGNQAVRLQMNMHSSTVAKTRWKPAE